MPEFFHDSVAHGRGEYMRHDVHINGMESFWALINGDSFSRYINPFCIAGVRL